MIAALALIAGASAAELPDDFVYLRDVAPAIVQDIRYASSYNFTGAPVPGYEAAECILTAKAAEALRAVDDELAGQGLSLIVWDCYRPAGAVAAFMSWTRTGPDTMKPVFYPSEPRESLVARNYIAKHSGHSGGSVVDLGIAPRGYVPKPHGAALACTAPQGDGLPDMGTAYDCFDKGSGLAAPLSAEQAGNRTQLLSVMESHGFAPYQAEWWHFRLIDQPHEGAEYNVPVTPRP